MFFSENPKWFIRWIPQPVKISGAIFRSKSCILNQRKEKDHEREGDIDDREFRLSAVYPLCISDIHFCGGSRPNFCSRIFCRGRRIIHSDYRKADCLSVSCMLKTAKLCRQYVSGEAEKIKEGYEKTDSIFRWILNDEPADYESGIFRQF